MKAIERTTHQIDATGKSLGRLASEIAQLLIGKHRPDYVPHWDMGDHVEVSNVAQVKITGNKLNDKIYYRHSGFPGGLKEQQMKKVFQNDPAEVLKRAVKRMLPKNKLQKDRLNRLKIN